LSGADRDHALDREPGAIGGLGVDGDSVLQVA
jgi:hypothetical protein